ncbi:DUF4113 domain-containing protein [Enterobacter bugandensis]|uniref:DUF4113 domain-containing protein n=2 Tax=Enterobacter bugandensis TaxID=881260 RepID=UPI003D9BFF64
MLNYFTPSGVSQLNLFDELQPRKHSDALMKVLDRVNHSDKGKVWFAGRGISTEWQMKRYDAVTRLYHMLERYSYSEDQLKKPP